MFVANIGFTECWVTFSHKNFIFFRKSPVATCPHWSFNGHLIARTLHRPLAIHTFVYCGRSMKTFICAPHKPIVSRLFQYLYSCKFRATGSCLTRETLVVISKRKHKRLLESFSGRCVNLQKGSVWVVSGEMKIWHFCDLIYWVK